MKVRLERCLPFGGAVLWTVGIVEGNVAMMLIGLVFGFASCIELEE